MGEIRFELTLLQAGVQTKTGSDGEVTSFSINEKRTVANNLTVDGVNASDNFLKNRRMWLSRSYRSALPDAQGTTRFERAAFMYSKVKAVNPNTKWKLIDVPDIAHDHKGIALAAQKVLEQKK